jgi:hypothetical protein
MGAMVIAIMGMKVGIGLFIVAAIVATSGGAMTTGR